MLDNFVPLIETFIPIWNEYIVPVFCGYFIAFVGVFIRSLIRS